MKISFIYIQNFRKLYRCKIEFSEETTLFVGANNSGKTSTMDALGKFLAGRPFLFNDFTLSNRESINKIGKSWEAEECSKPESISDWESILPSMDVWLDTLQHDIHHVVGIIPTLEWRVGKLGVRLIFQPKKIESLFSEYRDAYFAARNTEKRANGKTIKLFPRDLCDFMDKKLNSYFSIKSYILDPSKADANPPQKTEFEMECLTDNPLQNVICVNLISAQRGLSDPENKNSNTVDHTRLSSQIRGYYDQYLDPEKTPTAEDLGILEATENAKQVFDKNLKNKFEPALRELGELGYPGVANPQITITTKVTTTDLLRHDSAVQYSIGDKCEGLLLPEKYNGLGYQNLISLVFDLISFRDGWMRKGKFSGSTEPIEPLHLVLVEEPEAHLHVQVQQVFIQKAYSVLRNHEKLKDNTVFSTQLIISTHSSHIAREAKFKNLRYFKRLPNGHECKIATSKVVNLSDIFGDTKETDKFITRYLQTTHCDLFFADAAILVEGASEYMMIPYFLRQSQTLKTLSQRYITILSINGKHAHRLDQLIDTLAMPTLVISDLDSAEGTGHHKKAIPKRNENLISSNYTITKWLIKKEYLDDLLNLDDESKVFKRTSEKSRCAYQIRVAYQTPIEIDYNGKKEEALSRTFEDSLIYTNWNRFRELTSSNPDQLGKLIKSLKNALNKNDSFDNIRETIFKELEKNGVKAEFVLDLISESDPNQITIPKYILDGLKWLENVLDTEE